MTATNSKQITELVFRGSYIHVLLADNFEIGPESLSEIWPAISEACRINNCTKVLSEGRIRARRIKPWDAFESGTKASEIRGLRHACLFYDYQPDELSDFFKTVSANRGVFVEFFTDRTEALKWLGVETSP